MEKYLHQQKYQLILIKLLLRLWIVREAMRLDWKILREGICGLGLHLEIEMMHLILEWFSRIILIGRNCKYFIIFS